MTEQLSIDRQDILDIVTTGVKNSLEVVDDPAIAPDAVDETTRLVGHAAVLDSMGLVSLLLDIEQEVNNQFDTLIIIADERAMSQKQSPFRSVGTLTDYVVQLVLEQKSSD